MLSNVNNKTDYQVFQMFKNLYETYMSASENDRRVFHDNDMEVILERLGNVDYLGNRFTLVNESIVVTKL
jgi:hypothetical protein